MRRIVELSLAAAKKRLSPQTGWVHHFYEKPYELRADTIPVMENACFILALFLSRQSEHILEAKVLLDKLLAFEVSGNFPIYLHEYPTCKNPHLPHQLFPAFYWIDVYFQNLLGEELKAKLKGCLKRLSSPHSPTSRTDFLIQAQIQQSEDIKQATERWHPQLLTYISSQPQEKTEPQVTLYDLFMGELFSHYSKRALQDHPCHLRASLIQPFASRPEPSFSFPHDFAVHHAKEDPFVFNLFWGNAEHTHSLVLPKKKLSTVIEEKSGSWELLLTLPEELPEEGEKRMEIAFYCAAMPDLAFLPKASTFQLGDQLEILSGELKISLSFELIGGEGTFFGHLFRANRPMQLCTDQFETYDWLIGVRTVQRQGSCTLKATLRVEPGCQQLSP